MGENPYPPHLLITHIIVPHRRPPTDLPSGKYKLELSHPGSWLVMRHLLDLMKQLEAANAEGLVSDGP